MSKISDAAYAKEMEAQKKRAEALKHLEVTGCGPTKFEADVASSGAVAALANRKPMKSFTTDNTLEQLRKQKLQQSTNEQAMKSAIIRHQVKRIATEGTLSYISNLGRNEKEEYRLRPAFGMANIIG